MIEVSTEMIGVDVDRLLAPSELKPAYQPIVDIARGEVVAFEALARWPDLGVSPDVAFAAARHAGRVVELDWACRMAAIDGALQQGLGREIALFVNVEPSALGTRQPAGANRTLHAATSELRVVLELTERSLAMRPAELLRLVEWARAHRWGIALDDVGALPESLALLPFLSPDVIKLDMTLVTRRPDPEQAGIMAAVMAHSERTGAIVLAEGIETAAHLDQALALGATLGQGWFFGRPEPLPRPAAPAESLPLPRTAAPTADTPYAVAESDARVRIGRKGLLLDLSRHIETQGMLLQPAPVVLSTFQTGDRFTRATARRYADLALRCPLVAALGVDTHEVMPAGVHGVALDDSDPLTLEWTVTVIGPHYAGALIARDLGDDGPDMDRRYEFLVTHDRELVLAAARSLMARVNGPRSDQPLPLVDPGAVAERDPR